MGDRALLVARLPRKPPVGQHGARARLVEADVLRLDVAVDEAAAVGVAERGDELGEEPLAARQRHDGGAAVDVVVTRVRLAAGLVHLDVVGELRREGEGREALGRGAEGHR